MTSAPGDGPRGTRRRRAVAVPVAALVVFTGLGVVTAFGGLGDAPDRPPKQLGPGSILDQEQFLTTFVGSRATVEPGTFDAPDKHVVEIEMEVTNKGDTTTLVGRPNDKGYNSPFFAGSLLKLTPEIKMEYGPDAFASADGVQSGQLQPGMPTKVVIKYELPNGQRVPERVRMDVGTFEFSEGITLTPGWHLVTEDAVDETRPSLTVAAQVTLPVQSEGASG